MKLAGFLVLAALFLGFAAAHRAPEYDEAYSIFLTAGDARPAWPQGVFTAGAVRGFYEGQASAGYISAKLKSGDVHPPLYFWVLEGWRRIFGPSWLAARLLSVVFSLGSLGLLAWLAGAAGIPVLPALAIALLSYGFAYTGMVARGFALAQFLNLTGVALVLRAVRGNRPRLGLAGGVAFGAASFSNYLAIFTPAAVLLWLAFANVRRRVVVPVSLGILPFLALDAPYYLAQRNARPGQFVAFSPGHAVALLAKDSGAALFGGLPLYAGHEGGVVAAVLLMLFLACLACVIRHRHEHALLFALLANAQAIGLLALGFMFHNTPIEIRYLAFGLPYLALLLAPALPRVLLAALLTLEFAGALGLALAPRTMQPQALAARQTAAFPGALILLSFGNDGVGVPGPFIAATPDNGRLLLLRAGPMPDLTGEINIILVTLNVDAASRASMAQALSYFAVNKCFVATKITALVTQISNRCAHQQP